MYYLYAIDTDSDYENEPRMMAHFETVRGLRNYANDLNWEWWIEDIAGNIVYHSEVGDKVYLVQ